MFGSLNKNVKEESVSKSLNDGSFDYLVEYLERKKSPNFEGHEMSVQESKPHLLGSLYSWSQLLDCCKNKIRLFLDFVDNVRHKSIAFFVVALFGHGLYALSVFLYFF